MAEAILALRGWHPALSRAEAVAMFPEAEIKRTSGHRLLTMSGTTDYSRATQLSGTEAVLIEGGISQWDSIESLIEKINFTPRESMKVICWRHEGKIPKTSTMEIAQQLGERFSDLGATIDLENPEHRFGVVLDASTGLVAWGWVDGQGPGKHGWSAMRANKRPFFKPVSLEPRLARAVVNIAAGPDFDLVVDPMCGTGGLLIESALCNRPTLGIDVDPEMVEGAITNLEWAGVAAEVRRDDATQFEIGGKVSGVVLDPPYGRNSQGTVDDEILLSLTLKNIRSQVEQGCGFVLIMPTTPDRIDFVEEIKSKEYHELFFDNGWQINARYGIPIHSSLARQIIIASAFPQD